MKRYINESQLNSVVTTALLFWCALVVVSGVYVTTPLVPVFSDAFQINQAVAAWPGSIFSFFYATGFLVFGPLSDRFGRKRIIGTGLGLLALVTFTIGFIDSFAWLLILRGLQGFISATFAPAALSYVFDVYPKAKQVTATGFIAFGFLTAGVFGQVAAESIDQTFDWQAVFLLFGALYLLSLAGVRFLLPSPEQEKTHISVKLLLVSMKGILMQRNFQLCYTITFMLLLTFIGMYTVLGDYMTQGPYALKTNEMLSVRSAGLAGMIVSPLAGVCVRKFGLSRVLKTGLIVGVSGLLLLALSSGLAVIICLSVLYVAGISLVFPAIMTLIGELSDGNRAIVASLYTFILFIGATLGPVITIAVMQAFGHSMTFLVLAGLLAIGLVASFFIRY